jgi:hypothetical protein
MAVGNLATRGPRPVVVTLGSVDSPRAPIINLANGHPDEPGSWDFDGELDDVARDYFADVDCNLLANDSERFDAIGGFADLRLALAGTPGLPINPVQYPVTYSSEQAWLIYAPSYQDFDVYPGEDIHMAGAIARPQGANVDAGILRLQNLGNGKWWDGTTHAWLATEEDVANVPTGAVGYVGFDETATWDPTAPLRRTRYRLILTGHLTTGAWGEIASAIHFRNDLRAYVANVNFFALVGHNLPATGGAVEIRNSSSVAEITFPAPRARHTLYGSTGSVNKQIFTVAITGVPASAGPPTIGEVWIGRYLDLDYAEFPFDLAWMFDGQQRDVSGSGRETVTNYGAPQRRKAVMRFRSATAAAIQARDYVLDGTRGGRDPLMLAPEIMEEEAGLIAFHGRVGPEMAFSRGTQPHRTYEITVQESPLWSPAGGLSMAG